MFDSHSSVLCWRSKQDSVSLSANEPSTLGQHRQDHAVRLSYIADSPYGRVSQTFVNKMQAAGLVGLPQPMIRCVLPEYKDEHVWWFILQYLKSAGFPHTASAFCLELKGCRGVPEERFQAVSEVKCVLQPWGMPPGSIIRLW
jgi:hypothetical protein